MNLRLVLRKGFILWYLLRILAIVGKWISGHWKKVWGWCTGSSCIQRRWCCSRIITVISKESNRIFPMNFQMFPKWWWVSVGLITSSHPTSIRLVRSMHMHVFLPVTWVGKSSVASFNFALKRFFTCNKVMIRKDDKKQMLDQLSYHYCDTNVCETRDILTGN